MTLIENDVPLPEERSGYKSIPLSDLDVGESMLFSQAERSKVQSHASRLKKSKGKVFTIRAIDKDKVRVWRLR